MSTSINDVDRVQIVGPDGVTKWDPAAPAAPSGAALASKQAAPGTAGTPSADVTSVQGVTGGQPVPSSDSGPAWTSVWGIAGVPFTSADQHSGVASVTDAPTSGQKLVITDLIVSVDTAMSVTFKCETTSAVVFGPWYLAANTTMQLTPRSKKKLATADKKLQVITSVAGNITVSASYFSEV